jgi:cytochrome oxidase Cu insertion factor (SCO1/SenC/PrrC family)
LPRTRLAAGAALVLAALLSHADELSPRRAEAARMMGELMAGTNVGGDFTLTDSRGRPFRLADYRGRHVLLYFGFTGCPDVCPTDLLAIGDALRELGAEGAAVQPVFVTLDPKRDTRQVIGAYAANFHPRFVALTGSEAEVRKVARLYKIAFEKVPLPSAGSYTIDHAAFTFLLGRDGKYIGHFPPGTPAQRMAALIRDEIRKT